MHMISKIYSGDAMTYESISKCRKLLDLYKEERHILNEGLGGDLLNMYLEYLDKQEETISRLEKDIQQIINNYLG